MTRIPVGTEVRIIIGISKYHRGEKATLIGDDGSSITPTPYQVRHINYRLNYEDFYHKDKKCQAEAVTAINRLILKARMEEATRAWNSPRKETEERAAELTKALEEMGK